MDLKPIISKLRDNDGPIYETIIQEIRMRILDGTWEDGLKLPSDKVMASELGISHITLAKALNELRGLGLLVRRRSRGTFVKSPLLHNSNQNQTPLPRIAVIFDNATEKTFRQKLFLELYHRLEAAGLSMVFLSSRNNSDKQYEQLERIINDPQMHGCLVWSILSHEQVAKLLKSRPKNFPLVFMDKYYEGLNHDVAAYDNYNCALNMAQYFIKRGYKEFIWLENDSDCQYSSIIDRRQGLYDGLQGMRLQKFSIDNKNLPQLLSNQSGKQVIIISYFAQALIVKAHLARAGVVLPPDFCYATFETDMDNSAQLREFTGFCFNSGLAAEAVNILLCRLNGDDSSIISRTCGWHIVEPSAQRKEKVIFQEKCYRNCMVSALE